MVEEYKPPRASRPQYGQSNSRPNQYQQAPQPGGPSAGAPTPQVQSDLIVTNTETVPGYTIVQHLGLVQGNTVRSKHLGRDIMAGLKNIVGGELKGYTELLGDARDEATNRMLADARALGAHAVVNVRFSTSSISAGASELYVYGTAVKLG